MWKDCVLLLHLSVAHINFASNIFLYPTLTRPESDQIAAARLTTRMDSHNDSLWNRFRCRLHQGGLGLCHRRVKLCFEPAVGTTPAFLRGPVGRRTFCEGIGLSFSPIF